MVTNQGGISREKTFFNPVILLHIDIFHFE